MRYNLYVVRFIFKSELMETIVNATSEKEAREYISYKYIIKPFASFETGYENYNNIDYVSSVVKV